MNGTTAILIIARPFFLLALMFGSFLIARSIMRKVPNGRVYGFLSKPASPYLWFAVFVLLMIGIGRGS